MYFESLILFFEYPGKGKNKRLKIKMKLLYFSFRYKICKVIYKKIEQNNRVGNFRIFEGDVITLCVILLSWSLGTES